MRKLLRELRREFPGAKITITGRSHYRVALPGGGAVFASGTPSARDVLRKVKADVRRRSKATEQAQEETDQ